MGPASDTSYEHDKTYQKSNIRILGGWLDQDGGATHDTDIRISAAKQVWHRICVGLAKLRLSLKAKGRLASACVCGSLFYASEARVFSVVEMRKYNVFMNRCCRYLFFADKEGQVPHGTIRQMDGALDTMRY